jgi:hypothetical protein
MVIFFEEFKQFCSYSRNFKRPIFENTFNTLEQYQKSLLTIRIITMEFLLKKKEALQSILNTIKDRSKHLTRLLIKKKPTQNQIYAKEMVEHLQRKLYSSYLSIEQITTLEIFLSKIFDTLKDLSIPLAPSQEIERAFRQIKHHNLDLVRTIFEKLRKYQKERKDFAEEAKCLRFLTVIYAMETHKKLAQVFFEESKRLDPENPDNSLLEVLFHNELLFPKELIKNGIYNPKVIYPIPENGEVDLRRIKEPLQELYRNIQKYQLKNNNIDLYVKFGLRGGLRKEPQENEDLKLYYEVSNRDVGRIESLSNMSSSTIKSRRFSLEEIKNFLESKR